MNTLYNCEAGSREGKWCGRPGWQSPRGQQNEYFKQ